MRAVLHDAAAAALAAAVVLLILWLTVVTRRLAGNARKRAQLDLMAVATATREHRPRLGDRRLGTPIEHIPMRHCPDCIWEYAGQPVTWTCAIHTRPQPDDDLSLWDAELSQPRVRRRSFDGRKDQMR